MKKRCVCCILAVIVLLMCCAPTVWAAPGSEEALQLLGLSTLSQEQKYVYERLEEAVSVLSESVSLDKERNITEQDLAVASRAFCSDHPEYFWYLGDYKFLYTNQGVQGIVTELMPQYTLNGKEVQAGQEIEDAKAALKNKADAILKDLPDGIYQSREQYLHDRLAENVTYEKSSNDQTAYGALVDGKAVCAGYTRAYQYLLNLIGFSCWKIDGTAVNPQGVLEEHSWNLVIVPDFGCAYTDVTWDDQGDNLYHAYYGRSLQEISEDHTVAEWQLPYLPECNHAPRDYFNYHDGENGGAYILNDKFTGDQIACYFKESSENSQGSAGFVCDIWYLGDDFKAWLNANVQALAQELGFVGTYQCNYTNLGREYQLSLTGEISQPEVTEPTENPGLQVDMPDTGVVVWLVAGAGAVVLIVIVALICTSRKKK